MAFWMGWSKFKLPFAINEIYDTESQFNVTRHSQIVGYDVWVSISILSRDFSKWKISVIKRRVSSDKSTWKQNHLNYENENQQNINFSISFY